MDALLNGFTTLCELLLSLAFDIVQKVDCRNEASSILKKLGELDFAILLIFWKTVLERLHQTNLSFQSSTLNLNVMLSLLESLVGFIEAQEPNLNITKGEALFCVDMTNTTQSLSELECPTIVMLM